MFRKLTLGSLAVALLAGTASADTLREALVLTYRNNPTITGQREVLRGTDANVAIARAAGRPQISAIAGLNRDLTRSGVLDTGSKGPTASVGVDLSYPLFNGGSVRNSVRAAETRVEAGRATLRAVEGDILQNGRGLHGRYPRPRDRRVERQNVRVLTTNLEATSDRFEIGDLTRTDVAQSEARLQIGRANLATAQGRLTASEENYRRVIGKRPDVLAPPPPLPPLPATSDEAARIALANNPDLIAVARQTRAAGLGVSVERASRLPTISSVVSGNYVTSLGGSTAQCRARATENTPGSTRDPAVPGRLPAARIRAAQAVEGQLLEQTIAPSEQWLSATRSALPISRGANANCLQRSRSRQRIGPRGRSAERSVAPATVLDVLKRGARTAHRAGRPGHRAPRCYVAGFQC